MRRPLSPKAEGLKGRRSDHAQPLDPATAASSASVPHAIVINFAKLLSKKERILCISASLLLAHQRYFHL